jgi:hypothetical protein
MFSLLNKKVDLLNSSKDGKSNKQRLDADLPLVFGSRKGMSVQRNLILVLH